MAQQFIMPPQVEILDIYFKTMLAGYLNPEAVYVPLNHSPEERCFTYSEGKWVATDTYRVCQNSPYIRRILAVCYNSYRVWMMEFIGHYTANAIPCLKAALKIQCESRTFIGGRGPAQLVQGTFSYHNCSIGNNFANFQGKEQIVESSPQGSIDCGGHLYSGGLRREYGVAARR